MYFSIRGMPFEILHLWFFMLQLLSNYKLTIFAMTNKFRENKKITLKFIYKNFVTFFQIKNNQYLKILNIKVLNSFFTTPTLKLSSILISLSQQISLLIEQIIMLLFIFFKCTTLPFIFKKKFFFKKDLTFKYLLTKLFKYSSLFLKIIFKN